MPYWENDPSENLYMEVTGRANIGDRILAPMAKSGGGAAFNLAQLISVGDKVIHYDSGIRAIVLVSRVAAEPVFQEFDWISPNAGQKAGRHHGVGIELGDQVEVNPPVTLDAIKLQKASIFAIRRQIETTAGKGQPLYFPWIDYSGALRTALPYLAKFPRAALDLFPDLRMAVDSLG